MMVGKVHRASVSPAVDVVDPAGDVGPDAAQTQNCDDDSKGGS